MSQRQCSIAYCERVARKRGWCTTHYARWLRHGSTDDPRPTVSERFWSKVDASGDCWEWTSTRSVGYGMFSLNSQPTQAHRVAWELLVGPIPDGLTIDHLCRNKGCVNPDHLEPVPHSVNTLRAQKRSVLCRRCGHPKTMYGGMVRCRPCTLRNNRLSRAGAV